MTHNYIEDKEIVLALKAGDKKAFEFLYHRYWQKIYNFTRLYNTSSVEVEEVIQEVFVKLWEMRTFLDENKNIEGLLFIITRNLIFNNSRRSFNEAFYRVTILEAMDESNDHDVEGELAASDLFDHLKALLELLSPRQREVFILSRKEQLTYKEIAERLEISEKTVERHMGDALKFLRRNLLLYAMFFSF